MYLLIKYIKSVLWRVAKCLPYIEEARCLKVKGFWTANEEFPCFTDPNKSNTYTEACACVCVCVIILVVVVVLFVFVVVIVVVDCDDLI